MRWSSRWTFDVLAPAIVPPVFFAARSRKRLELPRMMASRMSLVPLILRNASSSLVMLLRSPPSVITIA